MEHCDKMGAAARSRGLLLDDMPTDVLAQILALTSPFDAARSSAVSNNFRSAAVSDAVWDRFLPPDIDSILSRGFVPVEFPSKKDLFLHLSARPIFIDGHFTTFSLDRSSGKKCVMLSPRNAWSNCWDNTPDYVSRFGEVADPVTFWWFNLGSAIETTSLSPRTTYGAFLVFEMTDNVRERSPGQTAWVYADTLLPETLVALRELRRETICDKEVLTPRVREDGWKEVEMGRFFNDHEDGNIVHVSFRQERVLNYKRGIIVEGIEFRPVIPQ